MMVRGSVGVGTRRLEVGVTELIAMGLAAVVLSLTFPALQIGVAAGQVVIVDDKPDSEPSPVPAAQLWSKASKASKGTMVVRDDFTGGPFLDWQIVRPQPDHVSFTRTPGCLTITTQRGTIHGDEENDDRSTGIKAKNLFLIRNPLANEGAGCITLHTKSFRPETTFQQVGLLCYDDDDNYLKWSYEYGWRTPATCFTLVRETNEEPVHDLIVNFNAPKQLWMRVTKTGNEYECAYSTDGNKFVTAGKLPWGDGSPKYLGFLAKNGGNPEASELDACIDSFEVSALSAPPARSEITKKASPAKQTLIERAIAAVRPAARPAQPAQPMGQPAAPAAAEKEDSADTLMDELGEQLDAAEEKCEEEAVEEAAEVVAEEATNPRKSQAEEQRDRLIKDEKWNPTHEQAGRIKVGAPVTNFCLDSKGRVLACCGDKKVRVFSQDGELAQTWDLDFAPEAIGLRKSDGCIFVGGNGQLALLSPSGHVQKQEAFPRPMTEEEIEEAVEAQAKSQAEMYENYIRGLKKQKTELEAAIAKDEKPTQSDEKKPQSRNPLSGVTGVKAAADGMTLEFGDGISLPDQLRAVEEYLKLMDAQYGGKEALTKKLREQMTKAAENATYTGLAVADEDLFVIASGPGYTYNAWRTGHDFEDAKLIVKGLRGCCRQMDCQTHDGDLWIPMNTQHKVCRYDRDGELVSSFGQRGREIAEAFGGCCEPKNMRFSTDGYVYCAESGPPVCVKRFTLEGEFKDTVCFPIYATGCVRVSVDLWKDKVFLLSPNENAIYSFTPKKKG